MKKPTQFRKAFTLLEVLIATSIFAVVMVMTTGVIAQSTNYQSKTTALRSASEEAARISDAISRDLKTAEGPLTIKSSAALPTAVGTIFKNGVALTDLNGGTFNYVVSPVVYSSSAAMTPAIYRASVVIINTKDEIKFYANGVDVVYGATCSKTVIDSCNLAGNGWWSNNELKLKNAVSQNLITEKIAKTVNIISTSGINNGLDTEVAFSGFTALNPAGAFKIQSYISYYVHSRTKDFDTLSPNNRAEAYLRSMVTMRNYQN